MKFYFDSEKTVLLVATKYYELIAHDKNFNFRDFLSSGLCFLNTQQCQTLYNLTYLNPEFPMGLVDKYSVIGCVETNSDEINKFNSKIQESLSLINQTTEFKQLVDEIIKCFVPLKECHGRMFRENGSGCSMHWFKGAIFLSLPKIDIHSRVELALNIVHELGHQCLMFYQDTDAIIPDGINVKVYSSIRKTDRPSILSFHALVAIYFMIKFCNDLLRSNNIILNEYDRRYVQKRYSELKSQFLIGAFALKDTKFTPIGLSMFSEMLNYYENLEL